MKLRLGHRVIAWDDDKSKAVKGTYIKKPAWDYMILDENGGVIHYDNCELDPEATEFLSGDEVEVSDDKKNWELATYIGLSKFGEHHHYVRNNDDAVEWFKNCRYPQKKSNDKINEIEENLRWIATNEDSKIWQDYPSDCRLILSSWEMVKEMLEENK
mgnify:CR=1 FL=1